MFNRSTCQLFWKTLLLVLSIGLAQCSTSQTPIKQQRPLHPSTSDPSKSISMFPPPEPGYNRYVIAVPPQTNERNFRVEIFVAVLEEVDDCNQSNLSGEINEIPLEGWGFIYYKVNSTGTIFSTLMNCDKPNVKKLVYMPSILLRYNSALPIVLYAPVKMKVQHKIWKGEEQLIDSPTG